MRCRAFAISALCACGGTTAPPGSRVDGSVDASTPTDAGIDRAITADGAPGDPDAGDAGPALCPTGSSFRFDRRVCPGTPAAVPPALSAAASAASPGAVITLGGLAEGTAPCLPAIVCTSDQAATLLLSDSPESPSADGVLYADTVPRGAYRIYVYHANGGSTARKFSAVALNQGATPVTVTFERRGIAPPSTTYVAQGKAVLDAWLRSTQPTTVTVPAGQRVVVDAALDALVVGPNELAHAIDDVFVDAPLKISVVTVGTGVDAAAATATLPLLARDGHDRGTFPGADVLVVPTVGADPAGVRRLRFGGNVTDVDLTGIDATTGQAAKVTGNYGVRYDVVFPSAGPRFFAAASARGGAWGGAAIIGPGEHGPQVAVRLPAASDSLGTTTEAILLGRFAPTTALPWLRFASAGGGSLPVDVFTAVSP